MGDLIKREIYRSAKSKVIIVTFIIICIWIVGSWGLGELSDQIFPQGDWKEDTIQQVELDKQNLSDDSISREERAEIERDLKIQQYILDHDIGETDWRVGHIGTYLFKGAGDQERQKAIDESFEAEDWRIYLRWEDQGYKRSLQNESAAPLEKLEADMMLRINQLRYDENIAPEGFSDTENYQDWRNEVLYRYWDNQDLLFYEECFPASQDSYLTPSEKKYLEQECQLDWYRVKNNVPSNLSNARANFLQYTSYMKYAIFFCMLFLFTGVFTRELETGTMRQTMLLPYSRKKIFGAKCISMVIMAGGILTAAYLISVLAAMIVYRTPVQDEVFILFDHVIQMNFYLNLLMKYFVGWLEIMMIVFFIIWFGVYGFSATFVTIAGVILYYGKFIISVIATQFHLTIVRFIPLVWFDWNQFLGEKLLVSGLSPGMCVIGSVLIGSVLLVSSMRRFSTMDF